MQGRARGMASGQGRRDRDQSVAAFPGLRSMIWVRWASLSLVVMLCLMAIEGHVYAIPHFYAPYGESVFSVPTVIAALLSLCAVLLQHPLRAVTRAEATLWSLVVVTAFVARALHEQGIRIGSGEMGMNTGVSFILLAVGQMTFGRLRHAPFVLSLLSMMLPFTALMGYLFAQPALFGAMSLPTCLMFLALGTACSARFARRPMMRALISGSQVGQASRLTLAAWCGWLAGEALVLKLVPPAFYTLSMFVLLVISSIFVFIMVLYLAMKAEQHRVRRKTRNRFLVEALHRDGLTRLYGREMGTLYMQCYGPTASVAMIMIGVDHWEELVARKGTETAERLLRRISGALYLDSGSEELLIRWDDGRFLLLSYALTPETLKDRAERLRQKAGATGDLGGDLSEVSISAGAACARRGDVTLEPAALRARAALLEAERAGCNRVVLSLVA
ncbi:GGDEF domain-containing protein, diguanylate cyclase (c-di-GMP synthetase) or its enzymatically inactive variants [Salipiger thiooxidans]|uniref:GGDEF domain-containing protein, diguanylate cyclase (C-di-GMP synthetase) or its enzymatically inactive variants n=1 Tax=Salipiger thiooxidans TaxID=282683 RepID=A0A1G7HN05_9RHOB|nr:GGDEF domain-containing protein, diguanylate cyclase (c-di-GMP synthetase) or its enzymatically inactive variants [Salipiger thiooxidans]